ncbi:ACHE [Branchiostoma lanceolatum]|uniref:Carboxylic ester hydrolase n=1 Tax=Branchiostoma lanceolatum TaxID=7740 RepID=A0A8J9Z0A1_BRALA|nr:ACHE [Branchiostoma lanceolatum]
MTGRGVRLVLLSITLTMAVAQRTVIETTTGKVRGKVLNLYGRQVVAFLGIPYAEPPVGPLRFKPPQPAKNWTSVFDAFQYGNSCYQIRDTLFPNFTGSEAWNANTPLSEDCLKINVWMPNPPPADKTVMVWIYGGGFWSGTASLDFYDGKTIAAIENVVVVSMNYRTGSLGFLAMGHQDAPGNMGLMDQNLALQWVQKNIALFGGDPQKVTILGESAGSVSVGYHLLSLKSRNLFSRAIMQSGAPNCPWAFLTNQEALRRGKAFARAVECPTTVPLAQTIECLRSKPADYIIANEWVTSDPIFRFPHVPVIDGTFITEDPKTSIRRGNFKKCNLLAGAVKDEGTYFLVYGAPGFSKQTESLISRSQFLEGVKMSVPETNSFGVDAIAFQYTDWLKENDGVSNRDALDDVVGDHNVICPLNDFAHAYASFGQSVYKYSFEQRASNLVWPKWMGTPHGYEIEFQFGLPLEPKRNYTRDEANFSRRMMRNWANFARTGNPNKESFQTYSQELWPRYTVSGRQFITLDINPPKLGQGPRIDECALWSEYLPKLTRQTSDISEAERLWKEEFKLWTKQYMEDWKAQYKDYVSYRDQGCPKPSN